MPLSETQLRTNANNTAQLFLNQYSTASPKNQFNLADYTRMFTMRNLGDASTAKKVFTYNDTNRDGILSKQEYANAIYLTDTNKDGAYSAAENTAYIQKAVNWYNSVQSTAQSILAQNDVTGDGKLSSAEYVLLIKKAYPGDYSRLIDAKYSFAGADKNNDGYLDRNEYRDGILEADQNNDNSYSAAENNAQFARQVARGRAKLSTYSY